MLQKSRSKQLSAYKFALVIPLLAAFVFTFNTRVVAQEKNVIVEVKIEKIDLKIDKDYTDQQMASDTEFMKERGIDLKFKGVKRNSAGEITAIKVSYKDNMGKSGNYSLSGDEPIEPFSFRVTGEGDERSIGFYSGDAIHTSNAWVSKMSDKVIVEIDDDELHEGKHKKHKVIRINSKDGENVQTWVEGGDGETKEVRIEIKDGEKVIMIDGEEVSEEELKILESDVKGKKIKIKKMKKGEGANVFIMKDSDDDYDVEVIEEKSGGFFFVDTDKDRQPLFIVDGKEMERSDFQEALKPDQIATINVLKGESAMKKYGEKGKDGVVEVTTKKSKN